MVHELATALGLAAGIVHPPPPGRPLEPGVVGHVGLSAEDGLNPSITTCPVEIQDPIHVSVVGDSQGCLAVGHGGVHQVADPGRPVQH